jgi:G:T/U-mismatch repair DNA glycosylase
VRPNSSERNEKSERAFDIIEKLKNNKLNASLKQIEKLQMQFFIKEKIIEDFNKRLYERVD